jgi:hypothetical protein
MFKTESQEFVGKIKIGESANLFKEKLVRSEDTTNIFTPTSRIRE